MWNKYLGMALILPIFVCSCASRRNTNRPVVPKPDSETTARDNSIKSFEMSNLDFYTFSGRAKAKIEFDTNSHDATAHVRINRDKAIWISVTALFNIEVARVLITPDSVKVQTKFPRRETIAMPFSYIHQYTNPGITFRTLQDLLVGNVSAELLRTEHVQVATSEESVIIIGSKGTLSYQYGMNPEKRPYAVMMNDQRSKQAVEVRYNQYGSTNGHLFPQRFVLHVQGKDLLIKADLQYNRLTFNDAVEMPF